MCALWLCAVVDIFFFQTITHLGDILAGGAEVDEGDVDEIRTEAHGDRFLFERVLRAQRHNLPQFRVLQREREREREGMNSVLWWRRRYIASNDNQFINKVINEADRGRAENFINHKHSLSRSHTLARFYIQLSANLMLLMSVFLGKC